MGRKGGVFSKQAGDMRRCPVTWHSHHSHGMLLAMNLRCVITFVAAANLGAATPLEAQSAMSPQEIHDRIVAAYATRAATALPAGDTLVSWYRSPALLHTVRRAADEITTGMLRADSLFGTARVQWVAGQPASFEVRWTKGDSVLIDIVGSAIGDTLRLNGATSLAMALPDLPWAVADYGMEDQLLPLLDSVGAAESIRIAVYRPFAAKWDTLEVTRQPLRGGTLFELQDSDGSRDWWTVSQGGVLVQLRREGQELERRPLETTPLFEVYIRLRQQLPE